MICAGIDAGSRAIKIVLIDAGSMQIVAKGLADQGVEQDKLVSELFAQVLKEGGVSMEDVAAIVATGYGRNAVIMAETDRVFVFGTTHLEALNSFHRRRSARQLRDHIARKVEQHGPRVPVFLTGDFNAVAGSPEIRAMRQGCPDCEPLFDAWTEAGGSEAEGATFRGLGLRDRMGHLLLGPRRIDYVFFRPRLTVRSVERVLFNGFEHREAALPSDHFPVVAEFDLAG